MKNEFSFWNVLRALAFLILLILKLVGVGIVAGWSWWWVTAPLWGAWLVSLLVYLSTLFILYLFRKK